MKAFYTTILAVVWALTASAQVILPSTVPSPAGTATLPFNESFNTYTSNSTTQTGIAYPNTGGDRWVIDNAEPLTVPSNQGNHLRTHFGSNDTRYLMVAVNTKGVTGIGVTWFERIVQAPITRNIYYRVGTSGAFTKLTTTDPTTTWFLRGASLPSDANDKERVEIVWEVIKTNGGNTPVLAIDNIEVNYVGVLPVELSSFNGQALSGTTKLAWTTATEKNNDKFEVERSQDGSTFSKVGEVKGSGNSSVKRNYTFTDKSPVGGVNYYRLRQVDTDGTVSFSNVVALQVAGSMAASVYPTVASSTVTISLQNTSGKATINVTDITGKTIATFITTQQEVELPVQNFKSGMYFVRVTDGQNQQVQRFIKE